MGGDPKAPKVGKQVAGIANATANHLPKVSNAVGGQMSNLGQAEINASQLVSPQLQALQAQLYAQYAPLLNQVGMGMSQENQIGQAGIDNALLNSEQGKGVTEGILANSRILDPEFYKNRESIGAGIEQLMAGLGNPNQLTGGERSEVERSLNRDRTMSGNSGVNSGIGTVQNAMTYGNALNNRRQTFMSLLGQGASANQALRSGNEGFALNTAMGKGAPTQFGGEQLTGAQTGVGANAMNLGSNLLGQAGTAQSNTANINANRTTDMEVAQTALATAAGTY